MSKQLSEARKLEARIIKRLAQGCLGVAHVRNERIRLMSIREEIACLTGAPSFQGRLQQMTAQKTAHDAYVAWEESAKDPRDACPRCARKANWSPATPARPGSCRWCWYADMYPLDGGDENLKAEWIRLKKLIPG